MEPAKRSIRIRSILVHAEFRARGLATALVRNTLGRHRTVLVHRKKRDAIALYRSLGFSIADADPKMTERLRMVWYPPQTYDGIFSRLGHISLGVTDLKRSIRFYDAVLAPLGYERVWSDNDPAGYGVPGTDGAFAIKQDGVAGISKGSRMHVAFSARTGEAAWLLSMGLLLRAAQFRTASRNYIQCMARNMSRCVFLKPMVIDWK